MVTSQPTSEKCLVNRGLLNTVRFFTCLVLSVAWGFACASPVTVIKGQADVPVSLRYWIPEQALTIAEVSDAANAHNFQPTAVTALPVRNRDVWYHFRFSNVAPVAPTLFLSFNQALYDQLEVFQHRNGGWQSRRGGLDYPYNIRDFNYRYLTFSLYGEQDEVVDVYFRARSMHYTMMAPQLQTGLFYFHSVLSQTVITVLIVGFLLGILFYMTLGSGLAFASKQLSTYLLFLAFTTSLIIYTNGYFFSALGSFPYVHKLLYGFLLSGCAITFLAFTRRYFSLYEKFPWLRPTFYSLTFIYILFPLLEIIFGPEPWMGAHIGLGGLTLVFGIGIGIHALLNGYAPGPYYLLAITCYGFFNLYGLLCAAGVFDYDLWVRYSSETGNLLLSVFFSMAVARAVLTNKEQQAALEHKAAIAETRDQTKSEFLAAMSHEIRTPINGVLGMAQMLKRTEQTKTQAYYTDIMINAGKALLHIISDLLDLSKIEAGRMELERVPIDLDQVFAFEGMLFANARHQENPEVMFLPYIDPAIPRYLIGDQARLQQILSNLLSNAFKFTQAGTITLKAQLLETLPDNDLRVKFSVSDTGIGIPQEVQRDLFSAYVQADRSTTRKYGGTGLGLAISKRLVDLLDGEMGVSSEVGEGSEFWFTGVFTVNQQEQLSWEESRKKLEGRRVAFSLTMPRQAALVEKYLNGWGVLTQRVDPATEPHSLQLDRPEVLILTSLNPWSPEVWAEWGAENQVPIIVLRTYLDLPANDAWNNVPGVELIEAPASIHQMQALLLSVFDDDGGFEPSVPADARPPASQLSVLVAEDNAVNQQVLKAFFDDLGVQASYVVNGEEALELFIQEHSSFNLVLLDCEMPEMDGFEAASRIRAYERDNNLQPCPIWAMTAHPRDEVEQRSQQSGFDSVISKPFSMADFSRRLAALND